MFLFDIGFPSSKIFIYITINGYIIYTANYNGSEVMTDNLISTFEEFERLLNSLAKISPVCCAGHLRSFPVQFFLLKYVHDRKVSRPSEIAMEFGVTSCGTGLIDRLLKLDSYRERTEETAGWY